MQKSIIITTVLQGPAVVVSRIPDSAAVMQRTLNSSVQSGELPSTRAAEASLWLDEQLSKVFKILLLVDTVCSKLLQLSAAIRLFGADGCIMYSKLDQLAGNMFISLSGLLSIALELKLIS